MNKRFEELRAQCIVPTRWDGENNRWIDRHLDMDKFVDLIVIECANYLEESGGMVEVAMEMKQHFGVKQ